MPGRLKVYLAANDVRKTEYNSMFYCIENMEECHMIEVSIIIQLKRELKILCNKFFSLSSVSWSRTILHAVHIIWIHVYLNCNWTNDLPMWITFYCSYLFHLVSLLIDVVFRFVLLSGIWKGGIFIWRISNDFLVFSIVRRKKNYR